MRRPAIWPRRAAPLLLAALLAWSPRAFPNSWNSSAREGSGEALEAGGASVEPEHGPLFIRAKKLIPRPGVSLDNVQLVVQDGRILRIGSALEMPEGARLIEGEVVCAAFIDPWSTLGVRYEDVSNTRTNASTRSLDAFDAWSSDHLMQEALRAGVTVARVQAGEAADVGGLGCVVRLDPELSRKQAALSADSNVAGSIGLSSRGRAVDVLDRISAVDKLVESVESGAKYREDEIEYRHELEAWHKAIEESEAKLDKDFKSAKKARDKAIKEAEEKGKEHSEKKYKEDNKPKQPKFDEDKAVFARIAEGELPLVVQVNRAAELRALLDGTRNFRRLRLVIEGGVEAKGFAEELAARHIPVIVWPTPQREGLPDEYDGHDLALAGQLEEAGVSVLIGSGGEAAASGDLPLLAELAIGHGFDREEAFAALTTRAAQVFDLGDRLGAVEVGKDADLLVLDGEPLVSTTRVRYVITGGRVAVSPQ